MAGIWLALLLTGCSAANLPLPEINCQGAQVLSLDKSGLHARATGAEVQIDMHCTQSGKGRCLLPVKLENVGPVSVELDGNPATPAKQEGLSLEIRVESAAGQSSTLRFFYPPAESFTFIVLGDTHGHTEAFQAIADQLPTLSKKPLWVIHCGDFTPSGEAGQYSRFLEDVKKLGLPVYTIPGNHDVRGQGAEQYQAALGPAYQTFAYDNYRFLLLDDSKENLGDAQEQWLASALAEPGRKLVFMHIPLFDPRGEDHALPETIGSHLAAQFAQSDVAAVFSGHIHLYGQQQKDNILYLTSGGGGGPLYATKAEGGFYHYLLVTVNRDNVQVQAQEISLPTHSDEIIVLGKQKENVFSLADLQALPQVSGESSFQNNYNNYRGQCLYKGTKIADLLISVGDMQPGDNLLVTSADGYQQLYSYENVYPQGEWQKAQGDMLLAYSCADKTMPDWQDGYRIAFLPEDRAFSNDDCLLTSAPGQGCQVYLSAGARFASNVVRLEVKSAGK